MLSSVLSSLTLFAQANKKAAPDADVGGALAGGALCFGIFMLLYFLIILASVIGAWKAFAKAGQPGWAAIVPIYNSYVLVIEIAKKDMTWFLLSIFVPFAVIVPLMDAAEKYGKSRAFGIGLAFLPFVFWPMLGFGDAEYRGGKKKKKYDDDDDDDYDDDRPRSKRSRDDDEEEEEERPRNKKRPPLDEDEDDAPPPPKKKKRRLDDDDE